MPRRRICMHEPVLVREVVELVNPRAGGVYIDGTLGGAGHARALLDRAQGAARLLGIDRDGAALALARTKLADRREACVLVHGNFTDMRTMAEAHGIGGADGIVLDFGVSSDQLDTPARGFSFNGDGPLDMRMDPSGGRTAADLVNTLSEDALADVLRTLGEEPRARNIARAIVRERQVSAIETTAQLADIVSRAVGGRRGRTHPATRTFQALRMVVNDELESIERGLETAIGLLNPGGRLVVISFHSLEDRAAKRCFVEHAGRWESLAAGGQAWRGREPRVRLLTRKPVRPGEDEVTLNPRARSAKLRAVERLADH